LIKGTVSRDSIFLERGTLEFALVLICDTGFSDWFKTALAFLIGLVAVYVAFHHALAMRYQGP
jgi:hypothetical protein